MWQTGAGGISSEGFESPMIVAGIDVGSLTSKCILLDDEERVLSSSICLVGAQSRKAGQRVLSEALEKAGLQPENISYIISTGYGREVVSVADAQVTEITCHAKGAHFLCPEVKTVIDIGGQDSKVVSLSDKGTVLNFNTNDKCAAGCGRFLEVIARALEVKLEDMGMLSLQASKEIEISSMCTIFAESEVIRLVAAEESVANIIAGVHSSIARRVGNMAVRIGIRERVMMTGGVAKNIGMVKALEKFLQVPLVIPGEPQLVGALGAAVIALQRSRDRVSKDVTN